MLCVYCIYSPSAMEYIPSYSSAFISSSSPSLSLPPAGRDYNATIEPVEFPSAETQVAILIPILDDRVLESEEGFTVVLSSTGTDENVVLGPRNTARVTITDDDSESAVFLT